MSSTTHAQVEFNQITEQVYLGTNLCCRIHSQVLQGLGIAADIDLEEERQETPPKLEYIFGCRSKTTPPQPKVSWILALPL